MFTLSWEDPLEEEMATHSSILAGIIPWTEDPGRLQSTGPKDSDAAEQVVRVLLHQGLPGWQ